MQDLRFFLRDRCRSDASDSIDVGAGSSLSTSGYLEFMPKRIRRSIPRSRDNRISRYVLLYNLSNQTCVLLSAAFICSLLLGTVTLWYCDTLVSIRRKRTDFFLGTSVTVPVTCHIATVGRSSEHWRFWVLYGSSLIIFWNVFDEPFQVIPKLVRQKSVAGCYSPCTYLFVLVYCG
jgi:hypothetical protein